MLVGNDFKIEADSLNVTLYEKRITKKTQKERWVALGYFSRVGHALKALVDLEVKKTELKDFSAVCQKQEELYKLIDGLELSSEGVRNDRH